MKAYLKKHEAFVENLLSSTEEHDWERLRRYHRARIAYMQHERLIHLLVTLFFALFTLISLLVTVAYPRIEMAALVLLFVALLIPYIAHYYMLENGVQRWYLLANEIDRRAETAAQNFGDGLATHDVS